MLRFPTAVAHEPAIDALRNERPVALGSLARTWFAKMRACGPDVRRPMHDGHPTACVGDVPFAYVNVGFFHGATLPDPHRILEGAGKVMRHAKLTPERPSNAAALTALIDVAYARVRSELDKR